MKEYNDQEFLYRQTPVDYDGIAKFTSIKGNTLGWNQLVPPLSAMQGQNGTLSVADNVATITSSSSTSYLGIAISGSSILLPKGGHKYLLTCEIKSSKAVTSSQLSYGNSIIAREYNISANTWTKVSSILSYSDPTGQYVQCRIFGTFEQGDTLQVKNWNIFDLTAMGLDSLTEEEFASLFPLPFYDFNQGTLLSFNGTGIKTANADETEEHTTNLPVSTYFPTGMKSAGSVYDELTESKAITRIGSVDLGSLTWAYRTTGSALAPYFFASFSGIKSQGNPAVNKANMICSKYQTVSRNETYFVDKTICADGSPTVLSQIQIKDSSFTDATAFTQAMNGVYLYYELATETETDADAEIFYRFYKYGTEQILPVNGATPTTAPIIADIEYYNQIESETPYRKFWLVNGNGERWDLTEKELKSFLENPQGLGFQKSIEVTRYGERAYKNTEDYNFPQVSGDILFYDSANATRYEKYNEFVRFLMAQPLTLYYQIPVSIYSEMADIYTLDCEVINLTKTESKTNRVLTSNIQINGLGFYEGDEIEINGTANTLTINNKGDFPVGFEIELNGDFKNPYFTLEQNGELYGEAKFDDNANNFSSVFVNSKDGEQNVVLKQNDSILPNPLAYQDLSISNGSVYVTFVKLAKGESTLTIGADSYTISGYTIRYTPIYRSV